MDPVQEPLEVGPCPTSYQNKNLNQKASGVSSTRYSSNEIREYPKLPENSLVAGRSRDLDQQGHLTFPFLKGPPLRSDQPHLKHLVVNRVVLNQPVPPSVTSVYLPLPTAPPSISRPSTHAMYGPTLMTQAVSFHSPSPAFRGSYSPIPSSAPLALGELSVFGEQSGRSHNSDYISDTSLYTISKVYNNINCSSSSNYTNTNIGTKALPFDHILRRTDSLHSVMQATVPSTDTKTLSYLRRSDLGSSLASTPALDPRFQSQNSIIPHETKDLDLFAYRREPSCVNPDFTSGGMPGCVLLQPQRILPFTTTAAYVSSFNSELAQRDTNGLNSLAAQRSSLRDVLTCEDDHSQQSSMKEFEFVSADSSTARSYARDICGADADISPRKRPRQNFSDDMERRLKSLVPLAAGCAFEDLSSRLKSMDSKDPIFGSLNNHKDIRLDRHSQLFALAWLSKSCEVSHTSVVTRTRIYARYVDTCVMHKLTPLMPTNFGKLVRVIFPNLTIRRLGMRGNSKYYYCGVKLTGDLPDSSPPMSPALSGDIGTPQSVLTHFSDGVEDPAFETPVQTSVELNNLTEHFQLIDLKYVPGLFDMIESSVHSGSMSAPLELPSIYLYLPDDFNLDYSLAENLQNSYRNHLTSIFELIRYMQARRLFDLCSTLLDDVGDGLALLADQGTASWVKDSDLVMYRSAAKMLARLHPQNVPSVIVEPLNKLAKEFLPRLSELLSDKFPAHFVNLKVGLAKQFIDLLTRLLRCIESASHISAILSNSSEKVVMLNDWLLLDIPDIVMRELPCRNLDMEVIIEVLDTQLVKLFEETPKPSGPVMARYLEFLFELPEKFPSTSPWLFLLLASNVLTTCIREMTLAGSRSFKSWWILRCWVDEFIKWSMELGGYLFDDFKPQLHPVIKAEASDGLSSNHSYPQELVGNENNTYVDLLEVLDKGGFIWI